MKKDEWLQVKQQLSTPWGHAELLVDGYRLTLQVKQCKALKFMIFPYVDGVFKGVWMDAGSEEGKRFLRPKKVPVFKPAQKKRAKEGLSKAAIKELFGTDLDKTFTIHEWGWPTFGPLQRHLIANNKSIELASATDLQFKNQTLQG